MSEPAKNSPSQEQPDRTRGPQAPAGADAAIEAEVKFELAEGAETPDLTGLLTPGETREHRLRAVYLDTPDLFLLRTRVTLRRREGGDDAGWHLKLPTGTDRLEVHAGLTEDDGRWRVPAPLREALDRHLGEAWTGRTGADAGLVPAAVLTTRRAETDLADADGEVVAVLCDDVVHALPADRRWRELEVELRPGVDGALLERVVEHLARQGVAVAESPSKLARALEDDVSRIERGKGPRRTGPAARVVLAYAAEQVAVLHGREEDLRTDEPGAVHKARVATRRLRSALRTFRDLFDRDVTDPLRDELRWYAGVLGGPRDAEVVRARVLEQIDAVPRRDYEGPVKRSATAELDRVHAEAHAALVEALDSIRYAALLDRLAEFLAAPPLRGRAGRRAVDVLPRLVDRAARRAQRAHAAARAAAGDERMHLLHETRKRAKAVRYAHELLAPAFGEGAARQAGLWEQVTEGLGQVQDIDVALEALRRLRRAAEAAGEPTYTYGYLIGWQTALQGPAVAAGEQALEAALAEALAEA